MCKAFDRLPICDPCTDGHANWNFGKPEFCSKHIVHTVCKCKMDFQPQRTRHVCMVVSQTTIFLDVGICWNRKSSTMLMEPDSMFSKRSTGDQVFGVRKSDCLVRRGWPGSPKTQLGYSPRWLIYWSTTIIINWNWSPIFRQAPKMAEHFSGWMIIIAHHCPNCGRNVNFRDTMGSYGIHREVDGESPPSGAHMSWLGGNDLLQDQAHIADISTTWLYSVSL